MYVTKNTHNYLITDEGHLAEINLRTESFSCHRVQLMFQEKLLSSLKL